MLRIWPLFTSSFAPLWVHYHHLLSRLLQLPPNKSRPFHLCSATTYSEHRNQGGPLQSQLTLYCSSTQNLPKFWVSLKSKSQSPSLAHQGPLPLWPYLLLLLSFPPSLTPLHLFSSHWFQTCQVWSHRRAFALAVHTPSRSTWLTPSPPLGSYSNVIISKRLILIPLKIAIAHLCTDTHTSTLLILLPICFLHIYFLYILYHLLTCYTIYWRAIFVCIFFTPPQILSHWGQESRWPEMTWAKTWRSHEGIWKKRTSGG